MQSQKPCQFPMKRRAFRKSNESMESAKHHKQPSSSSKQAAAAAAAGSKAHKARLQSHTGTSSSIWSKNLNSSRFATTSLQPSGGFLGFLVCTMLHGKVTFHISNPTSKVGTVLLHLEAPSGISFMRLFGGCSSNSSTGASDSAGALEHARALGPSWTTQAER